MISPRNSPRKSLSPQNSPRFGTILQFHLKLTLTFDLQICPWTWPLFCGYFKAQVIYYLVELGYWWLKVGLRAENLNKPAKSTRFWWQYAFMNLKSARPWEYDKAVTPLTELVCNPNFLELQMTSSEVKPLENKSSTVNIVAGHAAKSDDSIMSVGKTAFSPLTKSETSSNINGWKECCWNSHWLIR